MNCYANFHLAADEKPYIKAEYTVIKDQAPYFSLRIGEITFYVAIGEQAEFVGKALAIAGAAMLGQEETAKLAQAAVDLARGIATPPGTDEGLLPL